MLCRGTDKGRKLKKYKQISLYVHHPTWQRYKTLPQNKKNLGYETTKKSITIERKVIRGYKEFALSFGVNDHRAIQKWIELGMPTCHDGKSYMFVVDDVTAWIKKQFELKLPKIKGIIK